MNDFKRNKHFPEKIVSNLKFLNNLQPKWSRHVTIVHQTEDLHIADYTQLYDFLKYNQKEVDELRAKQLGKTHDPLALMANSNNPFNYPVLHQDQPSFNQNYMQQPMPNPEDISDPTTAMNMELVLIAKAFKLNYSTPTNNNQRILSNPRNRQIAQPGMNMGQDRQMQMVRGNGGNQFRQYAGQNVGNQNGYNAVKNVGNQVVQNAVQNLGVQNVGNQNELIVVPGIANQNPNRNGNVVAERAEGNAIGNNGNQIRCYNCRGLGHIARNCIVRPKRRDDAYLQTQLLIAQKEEAGIQLQAEEFDLMVAAADLDEIEEVNANCILMANLQQASTSGTQTDKAPVYDSDESAESVYQEQCLTKKINALHLSFGKQITTLNEEISNLNKQLSKEKSIVSSLLEEKKRLKSDFKIREDELLDKQIQLENKIKELDNILVKTGQSIQTMHMLSPKPDSFYHTEQKMALGYQNPFYLKQAQQKQQSLYNGKVLLEKHDPPAVYDSEETLQLAQESRLKMKQLNKEINLANYKKINHLSEVFVSQMAKSREELYFSNTSKMANVSKSISIPNEEFSNDTTPSVARKFLNKVKSTIVTLQRVVKQKMTLDINNWSLSAHQKIHKIIKDEILPIVNQVDARVQNFEIQFLKEAAKFVQDFKSLAKEADESLAKHKALELEIERLSRAVVSQDIMSVVQNPTVVETSVLQIELERTKEEFENYIIKKENEYSKLWNDWYKKCEECKYDKISYDKAYNDMQQKIEWLQAQLGDLKGKSKDTSSVSEQKDIIKGTSVNTQFCKQLILGNPPSSPTKSEPKLYTVTPFPKSKGLPKIDKTHALSKPVTSDSVPTPQESKVMKNDNVIAPGMFRINPFKPSREEKSVPNKVRASVRTNSITVSQPHVITKKGVNSNLNGLSSTGVDNTAKTRRPQSKSNIKNNRLAIRNAKSEVVCAMCKQCLIFANHDVCVLNYVNDKNSHGKEQKANVSNTKNQKKQRPKVMRPKKVGSNKRLASPKPCKPRSCLRWSPTGRLFDLKGSHPVNLSVNLIAQMVIMHVLLTLRNLQSNGFQIPLLFLAVWKFLGTVRFGNDHVAAIMGFGDLQWGNILITRVYFVEGLGHNLFSVGQFCDSDLEVAFRRNTCFVRNLEGVDLLKGNHTTNLYTINLHEMASASPICLMAHATSTKSWLWHQRLSHLNFDTINDLAKNDLVTGLPKFKYHKEHLCPSCEQGKSKRASHPPKPVPNSKQRLHLLHMDLCGPMRIASINGKQYVLVIVDDYSRYTWVHFLRSKDEAPEVIKTFLKRIIVLLLSPAARTMLIFSRAPLLLWAEAIATACYTQNRSIIHRRFNKTPYELINGRKPDISFLHVFGALCYPKNDHEDIGKLGAKGDIGFFIGYSADSCAYRVHNRRTKKIMETMNVIFDELSAMAFEQSHI
ncbi:retrovirus-related pol polyprotein from transposon TNT 1-94 [Tanacetum coccineum]